MHPFSVTDRLDGCDFVIVVAAPADDSDAPVLLPLVYSVLPAASAAVANLNG